MNNEITLNRQLTTKFNNYLYLVANFKTTSMKKVLLGLGCMLCFAGLASAQKAVKKTSRATPIEKAKIAAKATPAETAAPSKKEGTAGSLRMKDSKLAQKRLDLLKKDKTLDKRVSYNKAKKG